MALEKRTRVEIFLPLRSDDLRYRTVTEWLAEQLAFSRGGSTLTTPFAGLFLAATEKILTRDRIQILFCDFDLDPNDAEDTRELVSYLSEPRLLMMEVPSEEGVWIVYHATTRVR